MEELHEGNDSPWALVRSEAAAESPDWGKVLGPSIAFVEMARALGATALNPFMSSVTLEVAVRPSGRLRLKRRERKSARFSDISKSAL